MDKDKLVLRMAMIGGLVLAISIILVNLMTPIKNRRYNTFIREADEYIQQLTSQYQNELDHLTEQISTVEPDQALLGNIERDISAKNQMATERRKYLWMNDKDRSFLWGVPSDVFRRMEAGYNANRDVIEADQHFQNYHDFLTKLVDKHEKIDFSEFRAGLAEIRPGVASYWKFKWRYYNENSPIWPRFRRFPSFIFSAPVRDSAGAFIGQLYLKVDDYANKRMYYSQRGLDSAGSLMTLDFLLVMSIFVSSLFLWFLLPSWVYMDAKRRGVAHPVAWAVFALLSIVFGYFVYLIARPEKAAFPGCPQCEKELNGTKNFCPYCGFDVAGMFCPQCQYPIKKEWDFCPSCRASLRATSAETAEAPLTDD